MLEKSRGIYTKRNFLFLLFITRVALHCGTGSLSTSFLNHTINLSYPNNLYTDYMDTYINVFMLLCFFKKK